MISDEGNDSDDTEMGNNFFSSTSYAPFEDAGPSGTSSTQPTDATPAAAQTIAYSLESTHSHVSTPAHGLDSTAGLAPSANHAPVDTCDPANGPSLPSTSLQASTLTPNVVCAPAAVSPSGAHASATHHVPITLPSSEIHVPAVPHATATVSPSSVHGPATRHVPVAVHSSGIHAPALPHAAVAVSSSGVHGPATLHALSTTCVPAAAHTPNPAGCASGDVDAHVPARTDDPSPREHPEAAPPVDPIHSYAPITVTTTTGAQIPINLNDPAIRAQVPPSVIAWMESKSQALTSTGTAPIDGRMYSANQPTVDPGVLTHSPSVDPVPRPQPDTQPRTCKPIGARTGAREIEYDSESDLSGTPSASESNRPMQSDSEVAPMVVAAKPQNKSKGGRKEVSHPDQVLERAQLI
jgi:hypothetical protein